MSRSKTVLICIMILLLLFGCIAQTLFIRSRITEMLTLADTLSKDILAENWQDAQAVLSRLTLLWQTHYAVLTSLLAHDDTQPVSAELASLQYDLIAENYQQLPSEAARLTENLKNLLRTERLRLSNIL